MTGTWSLAMVRLPWLAAIGIVVLVAGCSGNDGGGGASGTGGDEPGTGVIIAAADLHEGDCFFVDEERAGRIERAELASCREDYEYEVIGLFAIDEGGDYPAESVFEDAAGDECDAWDRLIIPGEDTWADDDRQVLCLEEGEGSGAPEAGGDDTPTEASSETPDEAPGETPRANAPGDIVSVYDFDEGDCYTSLDDTRAEIADCDGDDYEYLVIYVFDVPDAPVYPGEGYFAGVAGETCPVADFYLYPTETTWSDDRDREVICLLEGPGLAPAHQQGEVVSTLSLEPGHCFLIGTTERSGQVELVACTADHHYRVTEVITVPDAPVFPGDGHFDGVVANECPAGTTGSVTPNEAAWSDGDRRVVCLEGAGPAGTGDEAAAIISYFDLAPGDCYAEDTTGDSDVVELVSCAGPHDYEVLQSVIAPDAAAYPGEDYFGEVFDAECAGGGSDYYLYPSEGTWAGGDREVLCLRTGPGYP